MTQCVYLIRASNGLTKIGATNDVDQRLRYLQTGSPLKLELLHVIETERPAALERLLHERFKARRRRGEWFRLAAYELAAIYAKYGTPLPDLPPGADDLPLSAPRTLTVRQVSERLKRQPSTLHRWLFTGKMQGIKLPGRAGWRVPVSEVERLERGE